MRQIRRRHSLDPDTDAECLKTDYEDNDDDEEEESVLEQQLRQFKQKAEAIKQPDELITIVSSTEVADNVGASSYYVLLIKPL